MRTLWAALACALVLAVAAGDAAAETIEIPDWDYGFKATWSSLEVEAAGSTIRCPITLEGSFASEAIATVARSAIGIVTNARMVGATCTGGTASVLPETMPWHLQYSGFTGVLPRIASVRLRLPDAGFSGVLAGLACRVRATDAEPFNLSANLANEEVVSVEAEPSAGIRLEGGFLCSIGGLAHLHGRTGPLATRVGQQVVHIVQGPAPTYYAVAVGDSFTSGEAGRWAGNTNRGDHGSDRDGRTAYWDNANRTGELIPFCHREIYSAEIRIGAGGGPMSRNLACSGARTMTATIGGQFKPGLDFPANGLPSQLTDLKSFAETNRHHVRMVVVSIGGNNFHFGEIVQRCATDYGIRILCRTDPQATQWLTPARVTENQAEIRRAIEEVHSAMLQAGNLDTEYMIMVQGYPQLLPEWGGFRYTDWAARLGTGGCPFYDADAEWANTTVLPLINRTIWDATKQLLFNNFARLDVTTAFAGRKLCENTVRLLEEIPINEYNGRPDLVDRTEWVNQIHAVNVGELMVQESLHPSSWAQRALRNCLRQAYNGGAPRSAQCVRGPLGKNQYGEPFMALLAFNP